MKDRFSNHAKQYAAFRPTYPKELYDFIFQHLKNRNSAWDVGCGNGQVAIDLSQHFKQVFATDISAKQLDNALKAKNIVYSLSKAEQTNFADNSFDLITVGQALHWFDLEKFFKEAHRVGEVGSVLAVWGYGLLKISPEIDRLITHFYKEVIGSYWDKERRLVDEEYRNIEFPFREIETPTFEFSFHWTLEQLHGYLTTWSSVQKYFVQNQINPVDELAHSIQPFYTSSKMKVAFPLFIRMGQIKK